MPSLCFSSYNIMIQCWEKSPDGRPSFDELYVHLQRILHEDTVRTFEYSKYCFDSFIHILCNIVTPKAVAQNDKNSYRLQKQGTVYSTQFLLTFLKGEENLHYCYDCRTMIFFFENWCSSEVTVSCGMVFASVKLDIFKVSNV